MLRDKLVHFNWNRFGLWLMVVSLIIFVIVKERVDKFVNHLKNLR